jgi:hypothetical protein
MAGFAAVIMFEVHKLINCPARAGCCLQRLVSPFIGGFASCMHPPQDTVSMRDGIIKKLHCKFTGGPGEIKMCCILHVWKGDLPDKLEGIAWVLVEPIGRATKPMNIPMPGVHIERRLI